MKKDTLVTAAGRHPEEILVSLTHLSIMPPRLPLRAWKNFKRETVRMPVNFLNTDVVERQPSLLLRRQ